MKRIQKLLALLMTLALVLSLAPAFALAEGEHTHVWKERKRTEPTCTQEGSVTYVCSCGEKKTETIPALGHDWDEGKIVDDPHHPGGKRLRFRCRRCDALMFRDLPQEEAEDEYGWEPPEEPEEPEIPEGAVSPASGEPEGTAKIELQHTLILYYSSTSMLHRPGCKIWLWWMFYNTGDVMVYDLECDLYHWNKNEGAYVPFDPGNTFFVDWPFYLHPYSEIGKGAWFRLEPYIYSEEDLENAKDGFLEIMIIGHARTEEGVELESEPLIYRLPIFDPSLVVEAEDCSAGRVPEDGVVKVGLTATSTGTETFTYLWFNSIGYDKDGYPYSGTWEELEGDLSWLTPGNPQNAVLNIHVTEADVEAGEVRRNLTLRFMRRYRTGGGTVFPDTPEDQIVSMEDRKLDDMFPYGGAVTSSSNEFDFGYPVTVEIVVPLLEPPEEPAPVPEPRRFCQPALTGLGDGAAEWTLTRCGEHAALAGTAESKTPEEALALWAEALDAEYEEWLAEADESLRPLIEAEQAAFREQLAAYAAAWMRLGGEEIAAGKAAELVMHKVSLLCFAREASTEDWAALFAGGEAADAADPEQAACLRYSNDFVVGLEVWESLCPEHAQLTTAAEDAEGWRELKTLWLAALNAETDARWLSADVEARELIAAERQSYGKWLSAWETLLTASYPEDPALVQQLLTQAIRARTIDGCGR